MSPDDIFDERKNKFLKIGRNKGFIDDLEKLSSLNAHTNNLIDKLKLKKSLVICSIISLILLMTYLIIL